MTTSSPLPGPDHLFVFRFMIPQRFNRRPELPIFQSLSHSVRFFVLPQSSPRTYRISPERRCISQRQLHRSSPRDIPGDTHSPGSHGRQTYPSCTDTSRCSAVQSTPLGRYPRTNDPSIPLDTDNVRRSSCTPLRFCTCTSVDNSDRIYQRDTIRHTVDLSIQADNCRCPSHNCTRRRTCNRT